MANAQLMTTIYNICMVVAVVAFICSMIVEIFI